MLFGFAGYFPAGGIILIIDHILSTSKVYCPVLKHNPHYIDIVRKKESEIYFYSLVLIIILAP